MPRARRTPACPLCQDAKKLVFPTYALRCPRCNAWCGECSRDGQMPRPGKLVVGCYGQLNTIVCGHLCAAHTRPLLCWSPIPSWLSDLTLPFGTVYLMLQNDRREVVVTCRGMGAAANWRELAGAAQAALATDGAALKADREPGFALCPSSLAARAILPDIAAPQHPWRDAPFRSQRSSGEVAQ